MMEPASDVRACPHCGGEIKVVAKLCRHCRRTVDAPAAPVAAPAALAPVPPPPPVLPAVIQELRKFVIGKQLVAALRLDPFLAARGTNDAGALLRQLGIVGLLTSAQAEASLAEFHQAQMARAKVFVDHAIARGLIPASHAAQAFGSYTDAALLLPIDEHLRAIGLLTADQAAAMRGSEIRWRATWKWLAMGAAVIAIGVGVYEVTRKDPPNITQICKMNGFGEGRCTFENSGGESGSVCGHLNVKCEKGDRRSSEICTQSIGVGKSQEQSFHVAGLPDVLDWKVPLRTWDEQCEWEFIENEGGK